MPDDIRIPSLAPDARAPVSTRYRAQQTGNSLGGRAGVMAAVALGGVVVLGLGGWAVMGRRATVVPVIEADSRPIRVKPENPGGMQVVGADEQVSGGSAGGAERLAPATETPAPQALRAQMQQGAPAAVAAAPAAAAVPEAPAVAAGGSPLPDTPVRPQVAARAAAPAVPTKPAAGGATMVQLAALDSEAAAQGEWQRLGKRMPELLGDRRPVVQRAERDGKAVWRVRTGGFADVAEATGFCTKVRAKGGSCTIASF